MRLKNHVVLKNLALGCINLIVGAALVLPNIGSAQEIARSVPVQAPISRLAVALSQQCGNSADADIVIMIDKTGSISDQDLLSEKNAAKTLLNFFNSAAIKPRVAIGTFNVITSKNNPAPAARIETGGSLTSIYGNDLPSDAGLFKIVNGIAGSGGSTDIGAAITVAQAELAAHATSTSRYIILISDGITNNPTTPNAPKNSQLGQCSDGNAGTTAIAAADAAEAAGTSIFAIHFGGDGSCDSGTGASFLGTKMATNSANYYEGNTDLSGVLAQISQSIACDDQDVCTADICDTGSNLCQSVVVDPVDTDQDGVTNCYDGCISDPAKTAPGVCGCGVVEDAADPDADNVPNCKDLCPTDPDKTAVGACGCGVPDILSSDNQTPQCLCHSEEVKVDRGALAIGPERLAEYANTSLTSLSRNASRTNKALGKRLKASAKSAKVKLAKFVALANQNLDQLPAAILTCSNTIKCSSVDNSSKIVTYQGAIYKLANSIVRTLNRATRLVYPNAKIAKKKTKTLVAAVRAKRDELYKQAAGYPKTQTVCSK